MTTLHPTVLWAQRKDTLFVTIDLQNCKDPQIDIQNDEAAKAGKLTFRGVAQSHATGPEEHSYVLDLEFFDEIDPDDVKQVKTERSITLVIAKKEDDAPHWPRLLKAKGKAPQYVKADWDKWVDEDDEEEGAGDDGGMPGGFDPSMLQQFQGMGGMGGGGMGGGGMGGMGGMEGLAGMMGGGGGAGGMGGMAEMMSKMGGMGAMGGGGGMEGFDLSSLGDLAAGSGGAEDEDGDSEDDMPPLDAPGSS